MPHTTKYLVSFTNHIKNRLTTLTVRGAEHLVMRTKDSYNYDGHIFQVYNYTSPLGTFDVLLDDDEINKLDKNYISKAYLIFTNGQLNNS